MSRPGSSSSSAPLEVALGRRESPELRLAVDPPRSRRAALLQNVWNALGYNLFWWIAVSNAARGEVWIGAWALLLFVGLALWWTQRTQRTRETQFLVAAMSIGWGLDSVLHQWGAIQYPSSEAAWVGFTSPPWIAALWLGFATMPRYSLGWLKRHPAAWAVVFGAVGGPLAFYGGTRFGAIEAGFGWKTYAILALEYGLLTWALVATHARLFRTRKPPASPRSKA